MFEVRVFDASGNLKKVISEKTLSKRSFMEINSPSPYNNARKKQKVTPEPVKPARKTKAQ